VKFIIKYKNDNDYWFFQTLTFDEAIWTRTLKDAYVCEGEHVAIHMIGQIQQKHPELAPGNFVIIEFEDPKKDYIKAYDRAMR